MFQYGGLLLISVAVILEPVIADTSCKGCSVGGDCLAEGTTYEKRCATYTCLSTYIDGVTTYHILPTMLGCASDNGSCYNDGESYILQTYNYIYNCTCSVNGSSPSVSCSLVDRQHFGAFQNDQWPAHSSVAEL
ncbi:uncharacterized protein LOC143293654 [Babylonia areolata]|uniref:uncharacterized protein LOC143293654 n=1 Tax=Babylonia areolata TaxID=304850 RepID=UPI003FCF69CF